MIDSIKQLLQQEAQAVLNIPVTDAYEKAVQLIVEQIHQKKWKLGDYSAGTSALSTVADEIAKYVPIMVKLCYAIAGVVAIVGAISVYIAMNNEEQDVKKKIMMVVGACIFLIAAAKALPLFFGIAA